MTPDELNDTIDGYPVKWNDAMPPSNGTEPVITFDPLVPPGYEFDAETFDGRKIKIKVRYVVKFSEDTE